MDDAQGLGHTVWNWKYHFVWRPKYCRKAVYGELRRCSGEVVRESAVHKESEVGEGHLAPDHVHLLGPIPRKYAVAQVVGFIKGKSALHVTRTFGGWRLSLTGYSFWTRGYDVSTTGKDGKVVRECIERQEEGGRRLEQLGMFKEKAPSGGSPWSSALSGSHIPSPRLYRR
jgi:putative transposase